MIIIKNNEMNNANLKFLSFFFCNIQGLIYHSSFIGKSDQTIKGKVSRLLANKCGIASRLDFFLDNQTNVFGEKLKGQIEDKLEFFKKGTFPKSNVDSMKEVVEEYHQQVADIKKRKKEKKKAKKEKRTQMEASMEA
jgi:nucleolar protein 56